MTSNVLCRFYLQGACAYGDQCRFSHNKQQDEQPQVCRFYLQGNCAYGAKCRNIHSKPASNYSAPSGVRKPPSGSGGSSSAAAARLPSGASEVGMVGSTPNWDEFMTPDEMDEFEQWQAEQEEAAILEAEGGDHGGSSFRPGPGDDDGDIMDPADIPLCNEYAATGVCSAGEECVYVHGEECEVCHQHVLHPTDATAAAAHVADCTDLAARLAKRVADAGIECCICFEKVLAKRELSARRFGLMFCDHAFCLGCIRSWRATGEVDTKTALRTCPICRTPTHFIVPSTRWPDNPEDKAGLVEAYKASLAQKDCVHFDHGDGSCPFGTSCFYRHAYRDGRLEEVQLRRAGNADGDVKVIAPVTLSSFLEASLTAQLALSSRPRRQQPQQQRRRGQQQQQQSGAGRGSGGDSEASHDENGVAPAASTAAAATSSSSPLPQQQDTEAAEQGQRPVSPQPAPPPPPPPSPPPQLRRSGEGA